MAYNLLTPKPAFWHMSDTWHKNKQKKETNMDLKKNEGKPKPIYFACTVIFILIEGFFIFTHTPKWTFLSFSTHLISMFLSPRQATCRRQPNPADTSGELWSTRSPANPACHFNHAPLRRAKHRGLADPAEAPGCPGTVGGEAPELQPMCWLQAGLSASPLLAFLDLDACILGFPCETHGCYRRAGVPFPARCLSCRVPMQRSVLGHFGTS